MWLILFLSLILSVHSYNTNRQNSQGDFLVFEKRNADWSMDLRNMHDLQVLLMKRSFDPLSIPRLVKEPPLKRGGGDRKRDMSVYPSAGTQYVPRIPLREPPLKRTPATEFFIERRSDFPMELLRIPLKEPPLKRSIPYRDYLATLVKEPPL